MLLESIFNHSCSNKLGNRLEEMKELLPEFVLFSTNKLPGLSHDSDRFFQDSQARILSSQWLHQQWLCSLKTFTCRAKVIFQDSPGFPGPVRTLFNSAIPIKTAIGAIEQSQQRNICRKPGTGLFSYRSWWIHRERQHVLLQKKNLPFKQQLN